MNPILVTGGAKRIGGSIALLLAQKGHDVVIHYRTSEREAESVLHACRKSGVRAEKIQGDFSTDDGIAKFLDVYQNKFPKTKGLVNNVGGYLLAPLMKTHKAEWMSLLQTNLITPIHLTKALVPKIAEEEGRIVNLGVSGLKKAKLEAPAYHVAKMALLGYTLCLAKELAPQKITVNMVSPGFTDCSFDLMADEKLPMGRPGRLTDVAHAIAFLFDKDSSYITGQNIEVAGGFNL